MSNFNKLWENIAQNIKLRDPIELGSDAKTAGYGPDERDGYDPENVDSLSVSTDLEDKLRDLIMSSNLYDPSITEDEEVINSALQDFLRRIKK
jgi:hypothetical protein